MFIFRICQTFQQRHNVLRICDKKGRNQYTVKIRNNVGLSNIKVSFSNNIHICMGRYIAHDETTKYIAGHLNKYLEKFLGDGPDGVSSRALFILARAPLLPQSRAKRRKLLYSERDKPMGKYERGRRMKFSFLIETSSVEVSLEAASSSSSSSFCAHCFPSR